MENYIIVYVCHVWMYDFRSDHDLCQSQLGWWELICTRMDLQHKVNLFPIRMRQSILDDSYLLAVCIRYHSTALM